MGESYSLSFEAAPIGHAFLTYSNYAFFSYCQSLSLILKNPMLKLYFQRLLWNDKLFLKNIIVAAPEVPTISTVKRYFDVSPYLIIEQEGHGNTHFILTVHVRRCLWSMVFFCRLARSITGMHNSLKF
jgi:hypothetical protein